MNANVDIDSKSVEELFDWYNKEILIVNRRYQRKLVWSLEEKQALISSIINSYPIPLILFVRINDKREILDGMQRLEAVMSFIGQKFDYEGSYFDLNSTALTKELRDKGIIEQKSPVLPRDKSTTLARYKFAVSEYSAEDADIDEVFRRINSNGKTLSRQELRSAGCLSNFSELVRSISTIIRGDTSHSDLLNLNSMSEISIGSESLEYGVCINDHFYVKNGILTRSCIRDSDDEELVANILAYISLTDKPTSGSTSLDSFYGLKQTEHSKEQQEKLESYIQTNGFEHIKSNYIYVYEKLKNLFENGGVSFKSKILGSDNTSNKSPRYYQAVFISMYELMINSHMEVFDDEGLFQQLDSVGKKIINVTDGGRWSASARKKSVEDLTALISRYFKKSNTQIDNHAWVTEIDNILTSSKTEQPNYDFKQGFVDLDGKGKFNDKCLDQVIATCVGINNIGKESKGFLLIGVSDTQNCSKRIENLYGIENIEKNGFYINGIDCEAKQIFKDLDSYFAAIKDKIKSKDFNESLKQQVLKDIKMCQYQGRHIIKIEVKSVGEVCYFNESIYLRQGTSTDKIDDMNRIVKAITNYNNGV